MRIFDLGGLLISYKFATNYSVDKEAAAFMDIIGMNIYFVPDIIDKHPVVLPQQEAKHCIQVLRSKTGDTISFTNGKGTLYTGVIKTIAKHTVIVDVQKEEYRTKEWNHRLHIALAPTKSADRFEWFLEKATEIGIDEITPILTENSERRNLRFDRCEKIIVAAMKQSLKFHKPQLNPLCTFQEFLKKTNGLSKYIAYCGNVPRQPLKDIIKPLEHCVILIGPEGDFSPMEVEQALETHAKAVSLGPARLRTETAGIVACHTVHIVNQ